MDASSYPPAQPTPPEVTRLSEPAAVITGMQQISSTPMVSAGAAGLATEILTGKGSITEAVESVGRLLLSYSEVDVVATTMTLLAPDDDGSWFRLGERAWLRQWARAGCTSTVTPRRHDAAADQALSMPWLSQFARRDVVALVDAEQLPAVAEQDRRELAVCGVRALVSSAIVCDGAMYGSVAVSRETPGAWPEGHIADLRLLSAALGSRMSATRARDSLADAIRRGDLARASQQQFFAAIGHELRTPIAAIVGTAEMLGADARDQDEATPFAKGVAHDADVLLSAGEHLLAIVDDLLNTGTELGGGTESQWVDAADAVGDVIHWLRAPALSAGVTVTADVAPTTLVLTTPSGLRQILTNLVGNAISYNVPDGSVRVTTASTRDEFGQPRVRVSVHDTGPGLTREQQRDVFTPFVRFAGPEIRGTGLGLSLSRSLAERDGGMVGVESAPGGGSVFWVDLPAAPVPAPGHGQADPVDPRSAQ